MSIDLKEWVPAKTSFDKPFQIGNIAENIAETYFTKKGLDVRWLGGDGQGDFLVLSHATRKMVIVEVKGSTGNFQSEKKRLASRANGQDWFYLMLHVKLDPSNLSHGGLNRRDLSAIFQSLGWDLDRAFPEEDGE